MAKVMLLTGSLVGYAYATEFFSAWYGGNLYERYHFINRATGPYAWCFYLMVMLQRAGAAAALVEARPHQRRRCCSCCRSSINVGMWFERFVIIVVSLHRAFLPSAGACTTRPSFDIGILVGSFGLFFTCSCSSSASSR